MKKLRFISLLLLSACGAGNDSDLTTTKATFFQEYGRDFLRPTLIESKASIGALHTAVETLCADTTNGDKLTAARAAWRATRSSSKHLELLMFGPAKRTDIKAKENLDEWPVRPDNIDLSKTTIANIDYKLHVTGLPTIGYLLFQETQGTEQCTYMTALALHAKTIAEKLHDAWLIRKDETSPTLAYEIENPGSGNTTYFYQQQVLQNIVGSGLNYAANEISMMKLANAVKVPKQASESEFSGDSTNDLKALLHGMSLIFFGKEGSSGGLHTVIAALNTVTATSIKSNFQAVDSCVTALQGPIEVEATTDAGKARVQNCLNLATTLTQTIETGLLGILGLQESGVESDND